MKTTKRGCSLGGAIKKNLIKTKDNLDNDNRRQ